MGTTKRAAGWVLDKSTQLHHYYREEGGFEAITPLCSGPVLLAQTVRRQAVAEQPPGPVRYLNSVKVCPEPSVCQGCYNKVGKLKKLARHA